MQQDRCANWLFGNFVASSAGFSNACLGTSLSWRKAVDARIVRILTVHRILVRNFIHSWVGPSCLCLASTSYSPNDAAARAVRLVDEGGERYLCENFPISSSMEISNASISPLPEPSAAVSVSSGRATPGMHFFVEDLVCLIWIV